MAKEGIAEMLDFLVRDQEVRGDFYVVIAKGGKNGERNIEHLHDIGKKYLLTICSLL